METAPLELSDDALEIIERDFAGLYSGDLGLSSIRGGQVAADRALATLDINGYAANRSQVLPERTRGASLLSPYIRHNIVTLTQVHRAVSDAPYRDREKFRDELLWQEYARHLYARVGTRLFENLRYDATWDPPGDGWDRDMLCVDTVVSELETDGWLENQTRMWLASHWSEAEVFEGAFIDSQQFYATDSDGFIVGKMTSSDSITATYLESGDDQGAFAENLTRTTQ